MAVKDTFGLPRNTAAALSVVLAPTIIGSLVFLFLYKDPFVRFHSAQALVTLVVIGIIQWFLYLTVILASIGGLLTIAGFVLWLMMVYKAWQGDEWEIPVAGDLARKLVKRL